MRAVLVRHGEPNYDNVMKKGFKGFGMELGELSAKGIEQAERVSHDWRLSDAQLIVSSPYTRALQTAAIISKNLNINISVNADLHEWIPDYTLQYDSIERELDAYCDFDRHNGIYTKDCKYVWEEAEAMGNRVYRALKKYIMYDKIIVVCHRMLMHQLGFGEDIDYCDIKEVNIDKESNWRGFVRAVQPPLKSSFSSVDLRV